MDKQRFMRNNSNKKNSDNVVMKGNYLMYYNKRENRIGLEKFDFREGVRQDLFISENASKDIEGIWDIESSFSQMDLLIEKYGVDSKWNKN